MNPIEPRNPYHYVRDCIAGKWKMTILHHIHFYGSIRFNQTLKTLPISEKFLSQQLKELADYGLVQREIYETTPLKVMYVLTDAGKELIPALDICYLWAVKEMTRQNIPIDPDAFVVHNDDKYNQHLEGFIDIDAYLKEATEASKMHEKVQKDRK